MPYRPGFHATDRRFGAPFAAILSASIKAGFVGASTITLFVIAAAVLGGERFSASLDEMLSILVGIGGGVAMRAIGGAFAVAFYILLFGFPVAVAMGNKIREGSGAIATALSCLTAIAIVLLWNDWFDRPDGTSYYWDLLIGLSAFAVPAAYFYRRDVITNLDLIDP